MPGFASSKPSLSSLAASTSNTSRERLRETRIGGIDYTPCLDPLSCPGKRLLGLPGALFRGNPAVFTSGTRKLDHRAARDHCMDSGGCLPAVLREYCVLRVVWKGTRPFFQERNPVKTPLDQKCDRGLFSNGPLYPLPPVRSPVFSAFGPVGGVRCWCPPSAEAGIRRARSWRRLPAGIWLLLPWLFV